MDKASVSPGLPALAAALAAASLVLTPRPTSAAAVESGPCPNTIEVDGRTAHLAGYICGSVTASVGTPWPVSIGVTVGHCTGCECGYVWDGAAGTQFTRRGATECGFGSPNTGGGKSEDGEESSFQSDGCQWGDDYIGWESRGC